MPSGINLQLFSGITPLPNLTGIQVLWWDAAQPKYLASPLGRLTDGVTDGSGFIHLDLSAVTGLPVGGFGFLLLYQLVGVDPQLSPIFASTLAVQSVVSGQLLDAVPESVLGRDFKDSVKVATAAGIPDLSDVSALDLDGTGQGVTLTIGDRVLVNHPSSIDGVEVPHAKRKGIYVMGPVSGNRGVLTRSVDADTSAELSNGATIANVGFGVNAGSRYTLVTPDPIVLDTTSLTFVKQDNSGLLDILPSTDPLDGSGILIRNGVGRVQDSARHFNDAGTTSSDIWSAAKVTALLAAIDCGTF